MSQCDAFGILPSEASAEAAKVIAVVNTWRDHFAHEGVLQNDILSLAERIDGEELQTQRLKFDQAQFHAKIPKKNFVSPFQRK